MVGSRLAGAAAAAGAKAMSTVGQIPARTTVGLIVIGDEILKGSTKDTNSHFICKQLHRLGVAVKKISVVADDVDEISEEVRSFSSRFDLVLTTGGVGPTHDDMTYMGLARAFSLDCGVSEEIVSACRRFLPGGKLDGKQAPVDKLSTIPATSTLLWPSQPTDTPTFPIVKLRNVVAFPGVPRFCERAFVDVKDQLFPPSLFTPLYSATVYSDRGEFEFSDRLTSIASRFEGVSIGSYPVMNNNYFKTRLVVECEDAGVGGACEEELREMVGDSLVHFDAKPWLNTVIKYHAFRSREVSAHPEFAERLDVAMETVQEIVDQYPLDQIALSFNGGKDCTVLLQLLRMKIDEKYGRDATIQAFHITCEDQFPEATQFIIDAARLYNMTVLELPGPLKTGLELLRKQRPSVTAVLMGSRASDPNGKYMKGRVQWTDADWPRLLRVCPVLEWGYEDVWRFLRGLCVPYCKLYDQGYTSLGGRDDTFPNEALKRLDPHTGRDIYLPAYRLLDGSSERHGRSRL